MTTDDTFSEITTAVEKAADYYATVKSNTALGDDFHEAGRGLDVIHKTLKHFSTEQATDPLQPQSPPEAAEDTVSPVGSLLNGCRDGAKSLRALFWDVSQATGSEERVQLYRDFLRENSIQNLAKTVVLKLMKNINELAKYYKIEEENLKALDDGINALESDPNPQNEGRFSNSGNGSQYNATTGATQNNMTGNGPNFVGSRFGGPLTFGKH
ncbi:hypothetical protein J3F84DRAFT_368320 [Trichoderma pleuroticola]